MKPLPALDLPALDHHAATSGAFDFETVCALDADHNFDADLEPGPHADISKADGPTRTPARRWAAGDPVVDKRLVTNTSHRVPLYGEDVWDLSCRSERPNSSAFRLYFDALPGRWRTAAKEIIVQRLNQPVPSLRRSLRLHFLQPESARKLLEQMGTVFEFMDRSGVGTIPDLEQERHLDVFLRSILSDTSTSTRWKAGLLKVFDVFRESRHHLSCGGLGFVPFPGASLLHLAGVEPQEENLTERIPEDVLGHLLYWALAYIDHFSKDILAAAAKLREGPDPERLAEADRRAWAAARGAGECAVPDRLRWEKRLETYLEACADGPGLPARIRKGDTLPAFAQIGRGAGVPLAYASAPGQGRDQIRAAGLPLQLACMGKAGATLPGASAPWREPFTILMVMQEARRLQVAAYIVVAYLSGMRDSEVQALTRGCIEEMRDERGEVYRHRLAGWTFKGEGGRRRRRRWIVIEPVARAVEALEALSAYRKGERKEDYLFAQLREQTSTNGLFRAHINVLLNEFAAHCTNVLAPRSRGAELPAIAKRDEAWKLKPTQFRRTLSWHIANQPFGVVAGMIQYGHASIQMFEGYAGTSDSGFAAEVARDQFLARLEDIVGMFENDGRGIKPAGPMAAELSAFFEGKREEIGAFPGQYADAKRVRELLKHKATDLHPGRLVSCFYTASQARCQKDVDLSERTAPFANLCDPDCKNACWTRKHLGEWRRLEAECGKILKRNFPIPRRQREIIERQKATAGRIADAIAEAETTKENPDG